MDRDRWAVELGTHDVGIDFDGGEFSFVDGKDEVQRRIERVDVTPG